MCSSFSFYTHTHLLIARFPPIIFYCLFFLFFCSGYTTLAHTRAHCVSFCRVVEQRETHTRIGGLYVCVSPTLLLLLLFLLLLSLLWIKGRRPSATVVITYLLPL
ncbi:hypothetical protein B0T17DRAFT_513055 [Bombardia bombarda]|uniref:Uncharacterized protein n=1 Tax=Bombardia bombarda TaxID=252184 RepID=A0AA39XHY3_9PEZI|nr:hypothetical protein B0T17DRAFT_513055 [Bombardia bombarda]